MPTAKLFTNGGSQALRIPAQFRLPGSEVTVEKRGEELVVRAKAPAGAGRRKPSLATWFAQVPVAAEDFLADRDQTSNAVESPRKLFEG